jgi:hypothetical protein
MVLVDPVCMMTCSPQLLSNFIYKLPSVLETKSISGVLDFLRFLCSRDLIIAQAFCRRLAVRQQNGKLAPTREWVLRWISMLH